MQVFGCSALAKKPTQVPQKPTLSVGFSTKIQSPKTYTRGHKTYTECRFQKFFSATTFFYTKPSKTYTECRKFLKIFCHKTYTGSLKTYTRASQKVKIFWRAARAKKPTLDPQKPTLSVDFSKFFQNPNPDRITYTTYTVSPPRKSRS